MLFINNDDVQKVLTIEDTLRVLEDGHKELAKQELVARPRIDIYTETDNRGYFHRWGTMEGSSKGLHRHAIRMKSDVVSWRDHNGGRVEDKYCTQPGRFCGLVLLFDTNTGEPLAIMQDGYLQHLRVGALAGLGAKYLARDNASTVGMLGAGGMADSHLMAFAAVRNIKQVKVYAPTAEHRHQYAQKLAARLDIEVVPCESPEQAVQGVDILSACTNSVLPVVFARMVEPGMHVTQVARELAPDVPPKIDVSVGGGPKSQVFSGVPIDDSRGFTTYLAGKADTLVEAMGAGRRAATDRSNGAGSVPPRDAGFQGRRVPLTDLIGGNARGRVRDEEISASGGVADSGGKQGLQFVTVGSLVYDLVSQAELGRQVPTEWFLQDIRD